MAHREANGQAVDLVDARRQSSSGGGDGADTYRSLFVKDAAQSALLHARAQAPTGGVDAIGGDIDDLAVGHDPVRQQCGGNRLNARADRCVAANLLCARTIFDAKK